MSIANITQVNGTVMCITFTRDLAPVEFTLPTGALRASPQLLNSGHGVSRAAPKRRRPAALQA